MTDTAHRVRQVHALLADGRTVEIRPARPEDRLRAEGLYERMSPENPRLRFFGSGRELGRQAARRVCGPERPGRLALPALHEGRVVGVAEYGSDPATGPGTPATAEVALAVADEFHHRGVGTLLLEHLVHAARDAGVTAFTAGALADNHAVQKVFADLGLHTTRHYDTGEVRWTIRLDPDEHYLAAVDERGRTAGTAGLRPLLRPRSVVVVGAGRSEGSVGRAVLRNLRRAGFTGRLLAVNPHAHSIERTPCYPSVAALPTAPELAVLAIPAHAVPETAEQCGKTGVRAMVVLTSGLDTAQGAALLAACRRYGMRLVGPNCLGIANTEEAVRALAHAAERTRWLGRPLDEVPELDSVDTDGARALVDAFLAEHPGGGWLGPRECARLLDHYGVPRLPQAWAADEGAAAEAAARLAGPDGRVALKAHWPGLVHKSDRGAVVLDVEAGDRARDAYRDLAARLGDVMTGAAVQPMARRGTELVAGVVQDEVFGPLVLFGLGGTATEVLADHAARLAPLTDRDVHDLITAPRCAPLLFGHRGDGPVDLEGLEQTLLRLSRMACDLPELAEADLNPVVARPDGVTAVDARVRLLPRHAHDPHLRRLR